MKMMMKTKLNGSAADNNDDEMPRERLTGDSIKRQIKLMLFKDPSTPAAQIIEHLARRSVALSKFSVEGIRADTRHTLKLLKEQGMLRDTKLANKL
jgi:hypothetical protein